MTAVTDELATTLFALDTRALTTQAVTKSITAEIVRWALSCGWQVRTEARVELPLPADGRRRVGFVDVLIRRAPPEADVAIEIDSTDKPWSVAKLKHAAAAGMHAIWVRWGDEAWAGVYDEVDVIQLPQTRRSAHQPEAGQLSLW